MRAYIQSVVENLQTQGYKVEDLEDPRPLGDHGGVWRCAVKSADEEMPAGVILKRTGPAWPWRWQDWSCLYFLSDFAGTRNLASEFYAADEGVGYYLLEDLGLGSDLGSAIQRPDSRGRLALSLLACNLAGLHAGTHGRERVFKTMRSRLPGPGPESDAEQLEWRHDAAKGVETLKDGLEARLAPALDRIQAAIADPGPFLALTHGDWGAVNVWYGDAGPRKLDFGNGNFRHALLDLTAWEARLGLDSAGDLWREYFGELERQGFGGLEGFGEAHAHARAWMALKLIAEGRRSDGVRDLLQAASRREGLEALAEVAAVF